MRWVGGPSARMWCRPISAVSQRGEEGPCSHIAGIAPCRTVANCTVARL